MKHVTVYSEEGVYAGWPANHGAWQWGNELLVGFMSGPYVQTGMHNVEEPYKKRLARSFDGGETWRVEEPNVDFEAATTSPAPSFNLGGDTIIRGCGFYDHGGEDCNPAGGFYLSRDRGHTWEGAYSFGLEGTYLPTYRNTTRTSIVGSLIFTSICPANAWGHDTVHCLEHDGEKFSLHGQIHVRGERVVMPSVVRVDNLLIAATRRRSGAECFIDIFRSSDNGTTWSVPFMVADISTDNGNPPALVARGNELFCAYGHRGSCSIRLRESEDLGISWSEPLIIRQGAERDIGYPQMFVRPDGRLVCVYYWSNSGECQRIEATII